jgi:hypothetical protein
MSSASGGGKFVADFTTVERIDGINFRSVIFWGTHEGQRVSISLIHERISMHA